MASIRTFVAVDVSAAIQAAAVKMIARLNAETADYVWVERDHLHITMNFLGDVSETEIPTVCRVITSAVLEFGSFELSVHGLGCFPNSAKPRVIWLGVDRGTSELLALHERIAVGLESLRFPREPKDYRPHLTLGRLKRGGQMRASISLAIAKHASIEAGRMPVKEIVIYSSFIDRIGPTYTAMSRIGLV